MRRAVFLAAALVALGGPSEADAARDDAPVQVITQTATPAAHDRVRIEVACRRRTGACRGELILGQQQLCSSVPVGNPRCQVVIGRGRFSIAPERRQVVVVRRVRGPEAISSSADAIDVVVTPYLRSRPEYRVSDRSRHLRLLTPVVVVRPPVLPTVVKVERLTVKEQGVRAYAHVPLSSTAAHVDVAGVTVPLHQDRFAGFVTHPSSFAVGGARWHGQAPVPPDAPAAGSSARSRLVACAGDAPCVTAEHDVTLAGDPAAGPICRLPRPYPRRSGAS